VDSAAALIADAIDHPFDIPSKERPPFGELRLAPLLDAQAEIAAAAGDADTAGVAAERLRAIAVTYPTPYLSASASLAEARAAAASGELTVALRRAKEAAAGWVEAGAPFEAASARIVVGEAHRLAGRPDSARMEWQAALNGFKAFGALGWAHRVESMLGDLAGSSAASDSSAAPAEDHAAGSAGDGPAGEDAAVFVASGDTRTVTFADQTVIVRDLKGFRYLERLLDDPDREFHALDLVAVEEGTLPTHSAPDPELGNIGEQSGLDLIDDQARDAYRRRLLEVEDDIEEATRLNDPARAELAQRDRDYLIAELSRAIGLGGRHRSVGSDAERARTSVTRSIRYALSRLVEHHPTAAAHLGQSVQTGTYCCYRTDPSAPVSWRTRAPRT
jgi:hypothetical protein